MVGTMITKGSFVMAVIDKIALALVIIGALNWGLIGVFSFDLVAWLFGAMSVVTRVIYTLVALGGIGSISLLFRNERVTEVDYRAKVTQNKRGRTVFRYAHILFFIYNRFQLCIYERLRLFSY